MKSVIARPDPKALRNSGDKWGEANDYVGKELPEIRRKIESAIRVELGEKEPNK